MGKKTPQINSSSTADIAFLLLCYFLMTTTMDQQLGIERQMPPMQTAEKMQNQKAHKRNLLQVKISAQDKVYVQGGTGYFKQVTNDIDLIREIAYEFFSNGLRNVPRHLDGRPRELNISDELLPEREVTDIPEFAKFNGGSPAFVASARFLLGSLFCLPHLHRRTERPCGRRQRSPSCVLPGIPAQGVRGPVEGRTGPHRQEGRSSEYL